MQTFSLLSQHSQIPRGWGLGTQEESIRLVPLPPSGPGSNIRLCPPGAVKEQNASEPTCVSSAVPTYGRPWIQILLVPLIAL